jgi:hypothetical protein
MQPAPTRPAVVHRSRADARARWAAEEGSVDANGNQSNQSDPYTKATSRKVVVQNYEFEGARAAPTPD